MSPELQAQIKALLIKMGKEDAEQLLSLAIFPIVEAAVKKSPTPIDDIVLAALEQPLKDELAKLIAGL